MLKSWVIAFLSLPISAAAFAAGQASFFEPTDRYSHGVLGDDIEWGGLSYTDQNAGISLQLTLSQSRVFEEIVPRLVDLTVMLWKKLSWLKVI